jgi:Family of unknown function (DUF6312)
MDKLVDRVTVVRRSGDQREAIAVYRDPRSSRNKSSPWLRPLERGVRRLLRAAVVQTQDQYQRHLDSNRKRRDGWLIDAPANFVKASRKGYNEARKAVPFRVLPKAR